MKKRTFNFNNTYTTLPGQLFTEIDFQNEALAKTVVLNKRLAEELGVDSTYLNTSEGIEILSGNNSIHISPYAQAYAGHQFGYFTMLGDGRATMLGEHLLPNGQRVDIQLKGSGQTPYSRGGDGKATLKSVLREYLVSEAIHALNIPTARSLAVVKTGELIRRKTMEEGAILTRVAKSHIRFGTFEYAKVYGGDKVVKELADYSIRRHYPMLEYREDKYTLFLSHVMQRQASLIAKWQGVGFVHGVMNTDNMLISGETIDYGPCAFLDVYDPKAVFSSIDQNGRYRYENQPFIIAWNMARLTESILHLLDEDHAIAIEKGNKIIASFDSVYQQEWLNVMCKKIGIVHPMVEDEKLIKSLLSIIEIARWDFTNTFRALSIETEELQKFDNEDFHRWIRDWEQRLVERNIDKQSALELMRKHNPVIIPRNHLLQKALDNTSKDSFELYFGMLEYVQQPFDYNATIPATMTDAPSDVGAFVSYCGT